tara:strand:- start:783 stop:1103 length:321 start_codon:yes stop_codon:yes gene_type:complete
MKMKNEMQIKKKIEMNKMKGDNYIYGKLQEMEYEDNCWEVSFDDLYLSIKKHEHDGEMYYDAQIYYSWSVDNFDYQIGDSILEVANKILNNVEFRLTKSYEIKRYD